MFPVSNVQTLRSGLKKRGECEIKNRLVFRLKVEKEQSLNCPSEEKTHLPLELKSRNKADDVGVNLI